MPSNNHSQYPPSPTSAEELDPYQNLPDPNAEPVGIEEWEEWQQEQDESVKDYYALLGVSRDATPNQIRSAYRALSLRFHPDKQPAEQRERTTSHFNNILIAYETLMNPHKRAIYDELGVDGLKQKFFEVGVKTMDPDEFKIWLQEQIRKQKVENVMSLVNSRGDVVIALDVSGAGLKKIVRTRESGEKEVEYRLITPVRLTKYVVKHSFTLPLDGLGELLTTPFNSSLTAPPEKNEPQMKHVPSLSLTASLGGIPVQTENKGWTYLSSPGLSVQIGHSFPSLPPKSPLSIASILAGLDFEIASTIFPQRVVSTSVSKSFGASRLVLKPTFNSSPLLKPPNIEATYVSSIGKRSSFFMQYNTGLTGKWPLALSQIFSSPPPSSHFTIGWVAMPIGESPVVEDVNDENYVPTHRPNRSKSTETWRITATACPSIGFGGQLGLSWGRTYFVGTPIGPSSSKNPKVKKSREGIRISVDATVVTVTALVVKIKATRKIFTHTRMGAGIGISAGGVIFTLDWSRLGQKISIPIGIASTSGPSVLYGTLAPFLGYALLEWVYLRPRERKLWKKEVEQKKRQLMVKVVKNRRRADELVGLMSDYVKHSQQKGLERGGLVILEARYGINGKAGEWVDVTIPLAGLIEDEQLVLPRGLNKSHLAGFYDPAPGEKKELWVKYLFKGKRHEITVRNNRGLAIPMKAHLVE
ncbi:uncharacterized protein LAJ45_09123 [Morchella importuna]|uniref:uncharacterized protein n=1 Tax=Morchella importuna TaxID=1174673 RepID=UPI001E8C9EBB|nr:uncharacterized protein LAJ45_09123 [Morchella importuna]KAH8146749.1 hypothetical protein LAJ45_09123 [Morchella importuna]